MKVAVVTNDGVTVSQHFGRARYYLVAEIQDGKVVRHEMRPRHTPHAAGQHGGMHTHTPNQPHGMGAEAQTRHAMMAAQIQDCEMLVAGGMGRGAVLSMESAGIAVRLTDMTNIEEVLQAIIVGTLADHRERVD